MRAPRGVGVRAAVVLVGSWSRTKAEGSARTDWRPRMLWVVRCWGGWVDVGEAYRAMGSR